MELRPIDWRSNPAKLKDDIDQNFKSISLAFNALLEQRLDGISIDKLIAQDIKLGSKDLSDIFLSKGDHHDVVRIQCGKNITTGGTENKPTIAVKEDPEFDSIVAGASRFGSIEMNGSPLQDLFYSRAEADKIIHPKLGDNLYQLENIIHVSSSPSFNSINTNSVTALTASFKDVLYKGSPLERWFGSHTHVQPGNNTITGGTIDKPSVSIVDDPTFNSIRSASVHADGIAATGITGDTMVVSGISTKRIDVQDGLSVGNALQIANGCINVGCDPELEVSSFMRAAMRIVAPENSPIHYALVVQNRNRMVRRTLNDQSVDFVVRGDGNVGIGAFDGLRSKLTIKSEEGHDQFQLSTPFTPDGSADKRGSPGNISWDDEFLYVRTERGWKRAALGGF